MVSDRYSSQNDSDHFCRFHHPYQGTTMVKLQPGGIYCTDQAEIICTGLGSCISACIWDERIGAGGMNHFLLPFVNHNQEMHWHPDNLTTTPARYGIHAMEMLINYLLQRGAERNRLKVKLFGGAQMMGRNSRIGEKNVEFILSYAQTEKLDVISHDLGGLEPRKIMFDPLSGRVWLKRIPFAEVHQIKAQETQYATELERKTRRDNNNDVELF